MDTIKVNLVNRAYNIIIGRKTIKLIGRYIKKLKLGNNAYVITNSVIKNKYGEQLCKALIQSGFQVKFKVIPDTEKSKSIEMSTLVIKDIARYDRRKQIFVIAFGGGVVGDLAGFIASIYKRGIPYIQIPTTLLAQVDSSIGGKTAIDLFEGKNLVGAFYQPRLVFSEIGYLKTLSLRQMRTGLAEVIKYGIIKDRRLFSYLERRYKDILAYKPQALEYIVKRSSQIKAKIVQRDEREKKGLRTILNFGHTVGHAIEGASGYKKYNHGEAIALGMLVAADISKRMDLISENVFNRIEALIKSARLPIKIGNISLNSIINAHYRDKKFIGAKNRFVLIEGIGRTKIVENIPLKIIKEAIADRLLFSSR